MSYLWGVSLTKADFDFDRSMLADSDRLKRQHHQDPGIAANQKHEAKKLKAVEIRLRDFSCSHYTYSCSFFNYICSNQEVAVSQTATPSQKVTVFLDTAGTRSPGTMIPTRFSGSAAESVTISPEGSILRIARSESTASGNANCSPPKPLTKRPPRT